MTSPRDAYHHGDLRNALVGAAVRLIEQSGPTAFSLREAAREVGVSANAAYRHFDDKSALMGAAAIDGHLQLADRMRAAMQATARRRPSNANPPSVARFKALGRAYVEFALERPALFRLMFGESGVGCLSRQAEMAPVETAWTLLGQALDALVADGALSHAQREGAELQAWSAVHGLASLALAGLDAVPDGAARPAAVEALLDFVVRGLVGPTP